MADILDIPAADLFSHALFHVCIAAAQGQDEVILRFPGRSIQ